MTRSLVLGLALTLGFAGCAGSAGGSTAGSTPGTAAQKICGAAGIRYVGSTDQGGAVCITLTADGKRLQELGFDSACNSALVHWEFDGVLPELGDRGRIDQQVPIYHGQEQVAAIWFRGNARGTGASGVITNAGFGEPCLLNWSAHRRSKR